MHQQHRRQLRPCAAVKDEQQKNEGLYDKDIDRWKKRQLEDELRDPRNFVEYLVPRPIRRVLLGSAAVSCLIASALAVTQLIQDASLGMSGASGDTVKTLLVDLAGFAAFGALFQREAGEAEKRIEQRTKLRQRQIEFGDRAVYFDEEGRKMSRLKEVDAEWVLRRLERWGKSDNMPFIGPKKGAILQRLVRQAAPRNAVEVGTMAGYSTILMAQALPKGSQLTSFEKAFQWAMAGKRFLWQARGGKPDSGMEAVDVRWGDAIKELPKLQDIDFLFLDGLPKEYLSYLHAAEARLAPGAVIVADNAGVFAGGGLKPYLEYVRGSGKYESRFEASTLEWRDDVEDGLEVSVFTGGACNGV